VDIVSEGFCAPTQNTPIATNLMSKKSVVYQNVILKQETCPTIFDRVHEN
jgi:hypothetical protein